MKAILPIFTLCLLAIAANLVALPAQAQTCSATVNDLNFGDVDVTTGVASQIISTLSVSCTGTPNQGIRLCINIGTGSSGVMAGASRALLSGSERLAFNFYHDAGYSRVWQPATQPGPQATLSISIPLPANGSSGISVLPVHAQIQAGQQSVPAGLYTSRFTGKDSRVSFGYNMLGATNCTQAAAFKTVPLPPFNVSATVISSCSLSVSPLDFGTTNTALSATHTDTTAPIRVRCTSGTQYELAIDYGKTGTGPTTRYMHSGSGQQVQYGVYQDAAHQTPWGNTIGADAAQGIGTGSEQSITAYGRIPPQPTPGPGTYRDTLTVSLTY